MRPARRLALPLLLAACGGTPADRPPGWVDAPRLRAAAREPDQWLTNGGGVEEQFYSRLDQVNVRTAARLGLAWEYVARTPRGRVEHGMQATAIVVDGVMYVSGPWSVVYALDARTGAERWRYDPGVEGAIARRSCCGVSSRGVQVWRGRVYVATLDGWLVALDAATGRVQWRVDTFIDRARDYTITGAPHVAGDRIVVGNSGADLGVRGYVSAYDLETGAFAWRFFTVPGDPARPAEHPEMTTAARTWDPRSAWEAGLGGTVWGMMAYDPALDLLYVGTGNASPYPRWFRSPAGGDNLYLASILALRPATGRLAWHYQTVPGEVWDYTVSSNLVLADLTLGGRVRQVLMTAPKNGFYYVLDRATGAFLSAGKYVKVTWATHVDSATGRPVVDSAAAWYEREPKLVFPSSFGGHNWMPMSYSPKAGLAFIPVIERGMVFEATPSFAFRRHVVYQGVSIVVDPAVQARATGGDASQLETREYLQAWDPVAQRARWRVPVSGLFNGGVLSTAGDLVVQGQSDGHLVLRNAADGTVVRDLDVGTGIMAAPMTYAIDGVQYVAVMAGYGGGNGTHFEPATAAARYENYPRILAFRLDGGAVARPAARREAPVEPPPPGIPTAPALVARGAGLFVRHCVYCHGGTPSAYPDLARLPAAVHARFRAIVLGGALAAQGMASFADVLDSADVTALHAYLAAEQRRAAGTAR